MTDAGGSIFSLIADAEGGPMQCDPEPAPVTASREGKQAINILIADDSPTFRYLVIEMLTEELPFAKFCEAGNGEEALVKLGQRSFDLLLLDINMPRKTGLEVLPEVRALFPATKVIVVSVHPEDQYAKLALDAGGHAYLDKDRVPEELTRIVNSVLGDASSKESGPAYAGMGGGASAARGL